MTHTFPARRAMTASPSGAWRTPAPTHIEIGNLDAVHLLEHSGSAGKRSASVRAAGSGDRRVRIPHVRAEFSESKGASLTPPGAE